MPTYSYSCVCGWEAEMFFKTLPSEKLQQGYPCPACEKTAARGVEPFFHNGASSSDSVREVGEFAMRKIDVGGRQVPAFTDNNGNVHEVRTSSDIERWKKDNQLGTPRFVNWRNPVTGKVSSVPQRTVMKADPVSGEPLDLGRVLRGSETMVESPPPRMPNQSKSGIPMKNGVLAVKPDEMKSRVIDPETRKPMKMKDLWGPGGGVPDRPSKVRI